jgi:hypothetical protein
MSVLGRDGPFRRAVERVDAELYAVIAERREAAEPGSSCGSAGPPPVLGLLAEARDEEGRPPSDAELRDQLVTLLAAGHETTATALAWAFERLARDPALVADLARGDEALLEATVKEVLRIRPVLSVAPREVVAPLTLRDGTVVPPGVQVAACLYLTHRRPDAFPPDPLAFRPRRWLDGPKPPAYAWIPFGGGARRCLGAAFALMEMRAVLRVAVARLRLEAPAKRGERVRRRAVSLTPSAGGRVIAR